MIAFVIILALLSLLVAFDSFDPANEPVHERTPRVLAGTAAVTATFLLGGCAAVPVNHQRLVSKPNMVFNDTGAFLYGPRVNAQLEPGAAGNGGAVAAGCTACR